MPSETSTSPASARAPSCAASLEGTASAQPTPTTTPSCCAKARRAHRHIASCHTARSPQWQRGGSAGGGGALEGGDGSAAWKASPMMAVRSWLLGVWPSQLLSVVARSVGEPADASAVASSTSAATSSVPRAVMLPPRHGFWQCSARYALRPPHFLHAHVSRGPPPSARASLSAAAGGSAAASSSSFSSSSSSTSSSSSCWGSARAGGGAASSTSAAAIPSSSSYSTH